MEQTDALLEQLSSVEKLARSSKWKRMLNAPFKYFYGIFFRELIYRIFKKRAVISTRLFWGERIKICLPACMDLYLTGGKSDDSEIRLTKFLIRNLKPGDHFLDIGAHVGYYSLLANHLTGKSGKIVCVEPSPAIYEILGKNIEKNKNITAIHAAVLEKECETSFFEFPVLYSEYNTIDTEQYKGEKWFRSVSSHQLTVKAVSGDSLIKEYQLHPAIIKIDVEGAENKVTEGLKDHLTKNNLYLVMEFLCSKRNNIPHQLADTILQQAGYAAYRINDKGELVCLDKLVKDHVDGLGLESDNIVYHK